MEGESKMNWVPAVPGADCEPNEESNPYRDYRPILRGTTYHNFPDLRKEEVEEELICKGCNLHVPPDANFHPMLGSILDWIDNGDYPGYYLCRNCQEGEREDNEEEVVGGNYFLTPHPLSGKEEGEITPTEPLTIESIESAMKKIIEGKG